MSPDLTDVFRASDLVALLVTSENLLGHQAPDIHCLVTTRVEFVLQNESGLLGATVLRVVHVEECVLKVVKNRGNTNLIVQSQVIGERNFFFSSKHAKFETKLVEAMGCRIFCCLGSSLTVSYRAVITMRTVFFSDRDKMF